MRVSQLHAQGYKEDMPLVTEIERIDQTTNVLKCKSELKLASKSLVYKNSFDCSIPCHFMFSIILKTGMKIREI